MKKLTGIIIGLLALLLCTAALADVEINETNFPDANFRAYVTDTFDKNGDRILEDEETAKEISEYKEEE